MHGGVASRDKHLSKAKVNLIKAMKSIEEGSLCECVWERESDSVSGVLGGEGGGAKLLFFISVPQVSECLHISAPGPFR